MMNTPLQEALKTLRQWELTLCEQAGEDRKYADTLWDEMLISEGMLREFAYYHDNQTFLGEKKVAGYSLVDLMIWQVDHFKAYLDRGNECVKYNGAKMLVNAFDTMLAMEREPEKYKRKMEQESGTDYPDKYH